MTGIKEDIRVPPFAIEHLNRLLRGLATGHITFHLKDGRIMEVETLVKTKP